MKTVFLSGRELAQTIRDGVEKRVRAQSEMITLVDVVVGHSDATEAYVLAKGRAAESVGIMFRIDRHEENVTEEVLCESIRALGKEPWVHGILVQLPLPRHINPRAILECIPVEKDVDGFTYTMTWQLTVHGSAPLMPCTPAGIIDLIDSTWISLRGKHAVIVGRSNIVGKPLALMMLARDATVTIAHSHTPNLSDITRSADIIVAAVGKPRTITRDMIQEGAVLIDVGISRVDGKLVGDIDSAGVDGKASIVTIVPGGVGPMTVARLLMNTVSAAENTK